MFGNIITHFVNISIHSRFDNETTPFVNIRLHVKGFQKKLYWSTISVLGSTEEACKYKYTFCMNKVTFQMLDEKLYKLKI